MRFKTDHLHAAAAAAAAAAALCVCELGSACLLLNAVHSKLPSRQGYSKLVRVSTLTLFSVYMVIHLSS